MKPVTRFGIHLLLFAGAVLIALIGEDAQRVALFGYLREFETKHLFAESVTASNIMATDAGERMLQLNPEKIFHFGLIAFAMLWAMTATWLARRGGKDRNS